MKNRRSPVRHKVRAHTRQGKPVRGFERGRGVRQQRRVAVGEKYPKRVTDDVYIYKALDKDQKNRFNIWLRIHTLQDRYYKTYRVNWSEADRLLEAANNYFVVHKEKWWLKDIGRREAYMDCLRMLGRQDENAFVSAMDNYKGVLHETDGVKLWGEELPDFMMEMYGFAT